MKYLVAIQTTRFVTVEAFSPGKAATLVERMLEKQPHLLVGVEVAETVAEATIFDPRDETEFPDWTARITREEEQAT